MEQNTSHTPQEPQQTVTEEQHEGGVGPTIGIIIIVALLIAGGFYFWGQQFNFTENTDDTQTPAEQNDGTTAAELRTVSTSTDVDAIEADLNATDLESIDRELEQIEADLNR